MKINRNLIQINFLILLCFILFAMFRLASNVRKNCEIEKELMIEYTDLTIDYEINDTIISSYYPKDWKGWQDNQYLTLKNGNKYLITIKENLTSKDIYFKEILKSGSHIKKNIGSDTLVIDKGESIYSFLIW